jgi:NAD+ kinase
VIATAEPVTVSVESDSDVFASFDGSSGHDLRRGDQMVVCRAPVSTRLYSSPDRGYFETLRVKLRWGEDGRSPRRAV